MEGPLPFRRLYPGNQRTMNNISIRAVISAIITLAAITGQAQTTPAATGVKRTDLQQHDLSIPGREAIQVRVDIAPGVLAPAHKHPGEEIIYVLEGSLEYEVDGRPAVTLHSGQVLFIPSGTPHSAKNTTKSKASELATYVVEKGKPLLEVVAP